MIQSESDLLDFLRRHAIPFERVEHPPVYTCAEAEAYRPTLAGLDTKNLFLRDERRNYYLLVTSCQKQIDLKALSRQMGAPKLHFGAPAELLEQLGLTPGSVTLLGLVNDTGRRVALVVDDEFWPSPYYLCHPLVNTATLALAHPDLLRFLALTGHMPRLETVPARAAG